MFPYKSMFRLLVTLSVLSLTAITLLMGVISFLTPADYYTDPDSLDRAVFYGNALLSGELYYVDDVRSFKSRVMKEFEYKEKLAGMSKEEIQELTNKYYRNVTIHWSQRDLLPMSKPLYDIQCLNYLDKDYDVSVSVIIAYHNELSVLLLRTLTTIMHRTLPKYLEEIILVDDCSVFNITEEVLKYADDQRMPLRYFRNEERLGIAGSRLRGLREAEGDVVVILDSHMEVSEVWLEPLLSILTAHPKSIAAPLLHMIQESQYNTHEHLIPQLYGVQPQKGVGIISMYVYKDEGEGRNSWDPFPTPAVLGGGLAAFRSTLLEYYPASIQGRSWGVENTRLSYRMWMCGEGAYVVPCSQVLHPNSFDWNLNRYFANKTEDLFPKLVYESVAELINFIELDMDKEKLINKLTSEEDWQKLIWDMSEDIRSEFNPDQCSRDYEWYKNEILVNYFSWEPDQFDYVGEVMSLYDEKLCLEINTETLVILYPCRSSPPNIGDNHVHGFTKNGNVKNGYRDGMCWDTSTHDERTPIRMFSCHVNSATEGESYGSQKFYYDKTSQRIIHPPSKRCLELIDSRTVLMMKCDEIKLEQRWKIRISPWFR